MVSRMTRAPSALHSRRKCCPFSKLVMARMVTGLFFLWSFWPLLIFECPITVGNVSAMPRLLRPYFPGGFFHVTARTQGRTEWFDATMRDHICDCIALVQ